MTETDFAELKLFITGPTYVRPEVRQAGLLPEFGHRDAENAKRFSRIMDNLRAIAKIGDDYEPIIFNGSGATAMDASIRSLVADDETVLNVSVGAFGDLYHTLAKVNGKKAVQLKFDYGRAIDLNELQKAMDQHKPAVVTFTHNETSTGVTNDIVAVCKAVRDFGAMPLVDGVSIFGGADVRISEARPTMYCTATQKALALPAGFGIGFVCAEALEKAEKVQFRGRTSDILIQIARARKHQTVNTPNCTLANQAFVQTSYIVSEEGVENRFARHLAMRDMVMDWVAGMDGYEPFAPEGYRSPTLSCVVAPEGVTAKALKAVVKETMRAKGYLYDPGYGKLNTVLEEQGRRMVFRIGHMGDITPDMLKTYLGELKGVLESL